MADCSTEPVAQGALSIMLAIHHGLSEHARAPGTTLRLADEYQRMGHKVELVSFSDLPPRLSIPAKSLLFPAYVAARAIRRRDQLDVLDASTADAWLLALLRRGPRPLLVTRSHGLEHVVHEPTQGDAKAGAMTLSWKYRFYWGGFRLWEVERSMRAADLIFVLNEKDRAYATNQLGIASSKMRITPTGVADHLLGGDAPSDAAGEPPRLASIGTFLPRKGARFLAEAYTSLLAWNPDIRVTLLGTGMLAVDVLRAFPERVHDRIRVVERFAQADLPSLLAGHQILLHAAVAEGFGKAVLEAMACGLAPVVSASDGPSSFISHDHNGLLVPLRDAAALEHGARSLLSDTARLSRIRRAAHATAQNYSWSRLAQERVAHYREALEERPSP